MKKTIAILLVAVLAVSSVFAGFSGKATVGLGYNWETKGYGFSNGTGFDVNVDLATAEAGNVAEGDIYAGIKATMGVKVANKASEGTKGSWIYDSNSETNGKYGLGLMLSLDEAYVAGANWKVAITGTQGATSYAKSFTTHKEAVKDAFGNKTTDTKDVADDVTGETGLFKTPGITAEVAGFKASVGFVGNNTEDKDWLSYNATVQTPEFDFDGITAQVAAGISRNVEKYNKATGLGEVDSTITYKVLGTELFDYSTYKQHQIAVVSSAKVGYATDAFKASVAADINMIKYGHKENLGAGDKLYTYFDLAANVVYAPVTFDAYYGFNGRVADVTKDMDKEIKALANTLHLQAKVDLANFDVPVALTVYGKDVINTLNLGAKAEVTLSPVKLAVKGGYIVKPGLTTTEVGNVYVGADVEYANDLFTAKAGLSYNTYVGKNVSDAACLSASASVETTAIIPGATLKLAYGAADNDMNFLKDQIALQPAQNLGKVDATCTIKF